MPIDPTRRQFLQVMAASGVSAVLFAGCQIPAHELQEQSRVQQQPEDLAAADETWYATTCRLCPAGCGVLARVVEGRVRKLEGNPESPVNQGKLCTIGQAGVQEEYHPDRVTGPLVRRGARGAGEWTSIDWNTALDRLHAALSGPQAAGQAGTVAFLTPTVSGHDAFLLDRFTRSYGAQWLTLAPAGEASLRMAAQRVFGSTGLPSFDVANARTVLAFGANFLESGTSPVYYGVQYGRFRDGDYRAGAAFKPRGQGARGRLIYVGPTFTGTAAAADDWLYVRPGYEGVVALSIAQVLLASGNAPGAAALAGSTGGLDQYAPERIAGDAGASADRIRQVAQEFMASGPSLAIGGELAAAQANGTDALSAILSLNVLVGNVGKPGGVIPAAPAPLPDLPQPHVNSARDWQQLAQGLTNGSVQTVLLHRANPVHDLPPTLGIEGALQRASTIISFSSFLDDTARLADLVLPTHLPLEDWGDAVPPVTGGVPTLSMQQPVVRPLYDTRGFGDLLLTAAAELGGPVQQALPWVTYRDLLQSAAATLQQAPGGSIQASSPQQYWNNLLQHGVWTGQAGSSAAPAGGGQVASSVNPPQLDGSAQDYPYVLVPYVHNSLGEGRGAHLPWLQAAPDPMTSVVWQTWVNVNPTLARKLGLKEGDMVRVESTVGGVEVPVYVNPAASPEVLSIPLGQGHSSGDRWANNRGVNPLQLLPPTLDAASGEMASISTRVRLTPTGQHMPLPKLEGDVPAYQLPGKEVLKVTNA